ncbi:Hypothetical protein A7982_07779 [Minicystis rosea]|nr:Hypothetical protein A7982_07779 [Minicystis rosea]
MTRVAMHHRAVPALRAPAARRLRFGSERAAHESILSSIRAPRHRLRIHWNRGSSVGSPLPRR